MERGKVHGSLARAGKVKGQTPKVSKQEDKKKKKTGRAKKRIQYNRRFVNAVATFGKRRLVRFAGECTLLNRGIRSLVVQSSCMSVETAVFIGKGGWPWILGWERWIALVDVKKADGLKLDDSLRWKYPEAKK
ncbi:hypothetical protein HK104_003098 [Borealophlyctis nickersoniae]|nr:hypothetical protein HK104_003098 [Borealophlyctis nickersoniae]